jgi:hypothetical protein
MVTRRHVALIASVAVAAGVLVIAPACGSGFLDNLSGGQRDSGAQNGETSVEAGADARACTLARVPEAPPPQTNTTFPGTIVIAIDAIRIDSSVSSPGIIPATSGFDVDNACTCPEPESCKAIDAGARPKCDGDGGTDNALGAMFATLAGIDNQAFGPDFATNRIRVGSYGAIVTIADWNREPNDAMVYLSFFSSQGSEEGIDAGKNPPIRMDGTDVWTLDPASVLDGETKLGFDCGSQPASCLPKYVTSGYVVDNTVVARLPDVPFILSASTGRIAIEMNDVAIVAKLEKQGDRDVYRAKGEFVGRWPVEKVLKSLGEVPVNEIPLCDQPLYFELARTEVCAGADVTNRSADDHKNKTCDAVSTTIRFEGGPAKLGRVFRPDNSGTSVCQNFNPSCSP